MNTLWQAKIPAFEKVSGPAYVVASYSNSIHTPGTFRGWRSITSTEKWLCIHNTMEWPDYYQEANLGDLLRFFDCYLKGVENGWKATPRVRYATLDLEGNDRVNRPAREFPPEDAARLDITLTRPLVRSAPKHPRPVLQRATTAARKDGRAYFVVKVHTPTEFVGYPRLRLWVEADGADDMDLFVFLERLSVAGEPLEQFNVANHGPQIQAVTQRGAAILKYKGSNGRLRVSMRHLDETLSTDAIPVQSFDCVEKLAPGQIACIDVDLFPIALALYPGEQLCLIVSGYQILGGVMPGNDNVTADNYGRHIVHTGDSFASYLQLCIKPLVEV